jgi:hypothetical protein
MLALKFLLMILGIGLFGSASALVVYDIFLSEQLRRLLCWHKSSKSRMDSPRTEEETKKAVERNISFAQVKA